MAYQTPQFPNLVWDGLSGNPDRLDRSLNIDPDLHDYDRIAAELIAVQDYILQLPVSPDGGLFPIFSAETTETVTINQLVAIQPNGLLQLADSNSTILSGLALTSGNPGEQVFYITFGQLSSNDWTSVIGDINLEVGAYYYLRQSGSMSTVPPNSGFLVRVGQAQSLSAFNINIQTSIKL